MLGRDEHGMMGTQREREGQIQTSKEVMSKGNFCNRILNIIPLSLNSFGQLRAPPAPWMENVPDHQYKHLIFQFRLFKRAGLSSHLSSQFSASAANPDPEPCGIMKYKIIAGKQSMHLVWIVVLV